MTENTTEAPTQWIPPSPDPRAKIVNMDTPSADRARKIPTSRRWTSMLASRPALAPLLFFVLILVYIWLVEPGGPGVLRLPILAALLYLPITSGHAAGDGLEAVGLRLDNLSASVREVGPVTAIGVLLVGGLGVVALGGRLRLDAGLAIDLLVYPAWALLQQYALQAFAFRRLREALGRPGAAEGLQRFIGTDSSGLEVRA